MPNPFRTGLMTLSLLALAAPGAAQAPAEVVETADATAEFTVGGFTVRAQVYLAPGPGPHPTLVEFKGFGQVDGWLSMRAPARSFNGVSLDFRGQNTSDGLYAVEYTVEDAAALVALLRTERARREWRVDPDRLFVVGTSAGSLAALSTLASDPGIRCGGVVVPFSFGVAGMMARTDTAIRRRFDQAFAERSGGPRPSIRSAPDLVARVVANAEAIHTRTAATRLAGKVVFLVGAQRDQTAPLLLHFHPLVAAARAAGAALVRDTVVNDTHNMPDTAEAVAAALWRWVERDCLAR